MARNSTHADQIINDFHAPHKYTRSVPGLESMIDKYGEYEGHKMGMTATDLEKSYNNASKRAVSEVDKKGNPSNAVQYAKYENEIHQPITNWKNKQDFMNQYGNKEFMKGMDKSATHKAKLTSNAEDKMIMENANNKAIKLTHIPENTPGVQPTSHKALGNYIQKRKEYGSIRPFNNDAVLNGRYDAERQHQGIKKGILKP